MQSHEPSSPPSPEAGRLKTLILAVGLTFFCDFLLWSAKPGLSWGAFVLSVGVAIAIHRGSTLWSGRNGLISGGLYLALTLTAIQSAVEISFSNVVVSLALMVILVGQAAYRELAPGWERTSEALWAAVKVPGRWFWASRVAREAQAMRKARLEGVTRGFLMIMPVVLLSVAFLILLGKGNAIFGLWVSSSLASVLRWLEQFDLSFGHFLFFCVLGTFSLWALNPSPWSGKRRIWMRTVPEFQTVDHSMAWWRSVLILGAVNAIFFFANTIDAIYLWSDSTLPQGVTVSQYVHEGVQNLMVVVFLSAVVLVGIFQQGGGLRSDRWLKRLGYIWIIQNGVISAGAILRVIRYIHDYHLTTQRVYAIAFVLLVIAGFALLTYYVVKERSFNWLLLSNVVATLTLFFIMQFLNVAGFVANYNLERWEDSKEKSIDIGHLTSLGAPGWEALVKVSRSDRPWEAFKAKNEVERLRNNESADLPKRNWRSIQLRRESAARRVLGIGGA